MDYKQIEKIEVLEVIEKPVFETALDLISTGVAKYTPEPITSIVPIPTIPPMAFESSVKSMLNGFNSLQEIALSGMMASCKFMTSMEKVMDGVLELAAKATTAYIGVMHAFIECAEQHQGFVNNIQFMKIADEIGLPIYLEVETELQEQLLEMYRENGYQCDVQKMRNVVMAYYNDEYVDQILKGIAKAGVFDSKRVLFITAAVAEYKRGSYATAGSTFAIHMSGMIRDVYDELCKVHRFTRSEKEELKKTFELTRCGDDSEKFMLIQILCSILSGALLWSQVAEFFLKYTYSSGEKYMDKHPKRHMICHGIQTNYNTKEMNLELIMCLDIISELAWNVRLMREKEDENENVVAVI